MDLVLVLRVVIGLLIAGHGAQNLFGVLGGAGLKATADSRHVRRAQPAPQ